MLVVGAWRYFTGHLEPVPLPASLLPLGSGGIAMLVTDHNVQQTLRICDRAYIIHEGKNLREGAPRDLINDEVVKEAYLASTFRGDEFG